MDLCCTNANSVQKLTNIEPIQLLVSRKYIHMGGSFAAKDADSSDTFPNAHLFSIIEIYYPHSRVSWLPKESPSSLRNLGCRSYIGVHSDHFHS